MNDDPHDAFWLEPEDGRWCRKCNEDRETCACGRGNPNLMPALIVVWSVVVVVAAALYMLLT